MIRLASVQRSAPTRAAAVLVAAGLSATPAFAQDDGGEAFDFSFDLNSVLVASFEADQSFLESEAERVRGLVTTALGDAYVVVGMAEVPPFTDYSADVYLRSCPDGQYIGCVFVVGGRAETDWTIGGRVAAVEGGYQVDLSFIDVDEAKLVLEFDVILDGTNDAEFQEGVVKVMDALVNGEVSSLDMRADPEAARAAEAEAEAREARAAEFAEASAYEDFEELERGDVGLDAYVEPDDGRSSGSRDDRVTFHDLEEMEERGGLTPWERAGLKKSQYRLYRNQGIKLRDFKAKLQGRKGEVLIRVGGKVSQGPWGQFHDTFFIQDNEANPDNVRPRDILAQIALQMQTQELTPLVEFELAFGVTPWMEIGVFGDIVVGRYQSRFYREFDEGQVPKVPDPNSRSVTSFLVGAHLGFAPMPAYPARPVLQIGASYWMGTPLTNVVSDIPSYLIASQMRPNNRIFVNLSPGFEVNAGKVVVIWARADIDIPVIGRDYQRFISPDDSAVSDFQNLPSVTESFRGVGVGGSIGLMFRIRYAGLR